MFHLLSVLSCRVIRSDYDQANLGDSNNQKPRVLSQECMIFSESPQRALMLRMDLAAAFELIMTGKLRLFIFDLLCNKTR